VPHLLRRSYQSLVQQGNAAPDVLINLTDDGWFWGSTVLDLQLACAVFRAIEVRRPVLIAANTGISASIDGNGRIHARSPKRQEDIIYADVSRDTRSSVYCWWGDAPAMLCFGRTSVWLIRARLNNRNREAIRR
jgi:apolipoprotein N-acyltransferase